MTAKTMDDAAGAPEANTQASRFASRPMLPRRPTRSSCAKVLSPALCRTRWQASTAIRIARNRERRVISSGPRAPRAVAVDSAAQPSHEHLHACSSVSTLAPYSLGRHRNHALGGRDTTCLTITREQHHAVIAALLDHEPIALRVRVLCASVRIHAVPPVEHAPGACGLTCLEDGC